MNKPLIVITGPTATGKTSLAVDIAFTIDGEIISADSRQVFRRMNLGTGKDLSEYTLHGKQIPYHLINILEPGEKYSVYQFQRDFNTCVQQIYSRNRYPVLCGGTGLYIESVIKGYRLPDVPEDPLLRSQLKEKSLEELTQILASLKKLHNTTDVDTKNRAIRAIEIALYEKNNQIEESFTLNFKTVILGIHFDRAVLRQRITQRLQQRIDEGMIDEARKLLEEGVGQEIMISYGLEYKYLTWYIQGKLSYQEFFSLLNTAIHQFAKRQATWFRRMERQGIKIHWLDGTLSRQDRLNEALTILRTESFI